MKNPKVVYRGDINSPSGYSRAIRNHIRALIEVGVDVAGENNKHDRVDVPLDTFWRENFRKILAASKNAPIKIWHETPEFYAPTKDFYNIAFIAWETTRIPSIDINGKESLNWVKQLNKMNEVWVPCSWNKQVLKDSGVVVPICVFPHPIDLIEYKPAEKPKICDLQGNTLNKEFTLVSVFQWTRRKNPVDLIVAFTRALGFAKDAKLVIKTYGSTFGKSDQVRDEIESLRANLWLPGMEKNIVPIFDLIPDKEMPNLYNSASCYVGTPLGEGFGMPFQEAMACGIPCIFPVGTAMDDFIDSSTGYPIKTTPEVVYGMGHIPWYTSEQNWFRPTIMDTVDTIRKAYQDWKSGELKKKGETARKTIAKAHSFVAVGQAMRTRLEKIQEALSKGTKTVPTD